MGGYCNFLECPELTLLIRPNDDPAVTNLAIVMRRYTPRSGVMPRRKTRLACCTYIARARSLTERSGVPSSFPQVTLRRDDAHVTVMEL